MLAPLCFFFCLPNSNGDNSPFAQPHIMVADTIEGGSIVHNLPFLTRPCLSLFESLSLSPWNNSSPAPSHLRGNRCSSSWGTQPRRHPFTFLSVISVFQFPVSVQNTKPKPSQTNSVLFFLSFLLLYSTATKPEEKGREEK